MRGFRSEDEPQRAELTDIAARIVRETPLAICLNDGAKEVWLPKSHVEINGDGTFTMPAWLALDKGLI